MNPEDRLDLLLDRTMQGQPTPPLAADEMARIQTANRIAQVRHLPVPRDFANDLEARLRQRAQELQNAQGPLRPGQTRVLPIVATRRARIATATLSGVLALLLFGWGLFTASVGSLPGDPLYGIKQLRNQVALSQASGPLDRTHVQITQLQGAITDFNQEINGGHSTGDVAAALQVVITDTQAAISAVKDLNAADHATIQPTLQTALDTERQSLHRALAQVSFRLRVQMTTQLGVLGEPVLTITQVSITRGQGSARTITIIGTHFAPGAQVVLNGREIVPNSQNAAGTQLSVTITGEVEPEDSTTIGVQNPDGTAALATTAASPAPGTTPTPGDDNHGTPKPGGDNGHHGGTPSPAPTPNH